MKLLTVFTPTYNRGYILPNLYESLKKQDCKDFCWLIVDDGSVDDTREIVKAWIDEGEIVIEYLYQENGGKMRAHNTGVKNCNTPLFLCVDSDDFLTTSAVANIKESYMEWKDNEGIAGAIAYKEKKSGGLLSTEFKQNVLNSTVTELYDNGFTGETSLVFKTDVIRKYLFPEIDGEKFVTEHYVYYQIDKSFKMAILRRSLIVCEYLEDGYTSAALKLKRANPKGYVMYYDMLAYDRKGLHKRIRYATALNTVLILSNTRAKQYKCRSSKVLRWLTYPIAKVYCIKAIKEEIKREKDGRKNISNNTSI